jgi:glycosyltransferase involved in cell wall biosynthesis
VAESRGKKIAFVTAIESSFITIFYNQFRNLQKQGYQLTAVSSLEFPENREFFKKLGVEFIELPIRRKITPFADLVSLFRLYRLFKQKRFDLVHTQMPKATLLGALAGWMAGIPVVNTGRPLFREMTPGMKRRFFILIEKLAARFTNLILLENPMDEKIYLELGIAPKSKLFIQGNGIDLSRFNPEKIPRQEIEKLRRELGIPESARVLGIVARYVLEKGYPELFTAFKELLKKYPDLFLLAATLQLPSDTGTVPWDLPAKMGIAQNTLLLKNRSDMERLYLLMDIFVLPTHRDCFPRSMVEAAAMARPIVASDITGCRVLVQNEKTGLLVPPKNPEALARAIERLLQNPALAKAMGANARNFALENLDEQKVCARISDCYQTLLCS